MQQQQQRFKKKGRKETAKEEDSDVEEEEVVDSETPDDLIGVGYIERIIDVNSIRYDTVIKSASNFPRIKIEEMFFDHRIRVNGERLGKKSDSISLEDQVDLIRGINPDNPDFLDIFRFEVIDIPDISSSTGRVKVKVRVFQKLTVEQYREPYTGSVIAAKEEEKAKRH